MVPFSTRKSYGSEVGGRRNDHAVAVVGGSSRAYDIQGFAAKLFLCDLLRLIPIRVEGYAALLHDDGSIVLMGVVGDACSIAAHGSTPCFLDALSGVANCSCVVLATLMPA